MEQWPQPEDKWFESRRIGFNSRHDWNPKWYHKLGWPFFGGDQWGRMTVVIGTGFTGYLWWSYRTCWKCQDCHAMREQTYRLRMEDWAEHQDKLRRGQCTCENLDVYRTRQDGGKIYGWCECGHDFDLHDEWGACEFMGMPIPKRVNTSMSPMENDPPENLEIGSSA